MRCCNNILAIITLVCYKKTEMVKITAADNTADTVRAVLLWPIRPFYSTLLFNIFADLDKQYKIWWATKCWCNIIGWATTTPSFMPAREPIRTNDLVAEHSWGALEKDVEPQNLLWECDHVAANLSLW